MNWTNYHSHCHYCDGKMPPEEHILAAISQGVKAYGFSSHCPVPFENSWSLKKEALNDYLAEIDALKSKYAPQIEIYKSLEIDYIPGMISPNSKLITGAKLDYTIGSVHFVKEPANDFLWEIDNTTAKFKDGLQTLYQGDIRRGVHAYYAAIRDMVRSAPPDIVGHIDKIKMHNSTQPFFDENEAWYKKEVRQTLEEIKAAKLIVEVNTRGIYKKLSADPYPGPVVLKEIQQMNIPVCLNSDSHHPQEITKEFENAATLLKSTGFKKMRILYRGEWTDVAFSERGLTL